MMIEQPDRYYKLSVPQNYNILTGQKTSGSFETKSQQKLFMFGCSKEQESFLSLYLPWSTQPILISLFVSRMFRKGVTRCSFNFVEKLMTMQEITISKIKICTITSGIKFCVLNTK